MMLSNLKLSSRLLPEYSLPWALIREIIQGTPRPPRGSLWVLGCESITSNELDTLQITANGSAATRLIHESLEPQQRAQSAFVDPLVFVFWAVDTAGADVLCLLVQFKTVASRDQDHVGASVALSGHQRLQVHGPRWRRLFASIDMFQTHLNSPTFSSMNIARTCCSSTSNSIEGRRTSTTPRIALDYFPLRATTTLKSSA